MGNQILQHSPQFDFESLMNLQNKSDAYDDTGWDPNEDVNGKGPIFVENFDPFHSKIIYQLLKDG